MRTRLSLREWERREVDLPPPDAEVLEGEFARYLELQPRGRGRVRLRAKSYVGTIVLRDTEIRIRPKCGLRNLFWMLGWAYGLAEHSPEVTQIEEVDDLREFLLAMLVERVELLLRRGLRRGYIEQSDDLPVLRGRLDFDRQMRRPLAADLKLPCRFEEYTEDLPFNQALAFTLRQAGTSAVPSLAARLRRLRLALGGITRRRFAADELERFEYDRLTQHYAPIHALCRIILEARGGESTDGELPVGCLLVDMNRLFERFVAAWIDVHLQEPWRIVAQSNRSLDLGRRLPIIPDLVIHHHATPALAADTKYKIGTRGTPDTSDAYQALAYCRSLGVRRCTLLYPDLTREHRFTTTDHQNEIVADGVDLAQELPELEASMRSLVERLLRSARQEVSRARRSSEASTSLSLQR